MEKTVQNSDKLRKIEDLLEGVMNALTNLTEENFDSKFFSAKSKMEQVRLEKVRNWGKFSKFEPSKKIVQLAKLIPERYDNVIKDWANKLKLVQKEIELTKNQKKITIYNR